MVDAPTVDPETFDIPEGREPGMAPGELQDRPGAPEPRLEVLAYGPSGTEEAHIEELEQLEGFHSSWENVWLNVDGTGDAELLAEIGEIFALPPLILEDIQLVPQRPRAQIVDERLFIVALMPRPGDNPVTIEQVSLVLGEDHVVTFQEYIGGDVFDPVRNRIREGRGKVRQSGADYLAYALLDAIVDSYFPLLETYHDTLLELEARILEEPDRDHAADVHEYKRSIVLLERASRPQRDMVASLSRIGSEFFSEQTRPYLQDCVDNAIHVTEWSDSARETAKSLMDLHISMTGRRMNEIMKVLTIIATIFIPLTFIAGIYGMNFDPAASPWNMPELQWQFGYPVVLAVMVAIAIGMLVYFVREGWIALGRSK